MSQIENFTVHAYGQDYDLALLGRDAISEIPDAETREWATEKARMIAGYGAIMAGVEDPDNLRWIARRGFEPRD